ncbi:hypothetical protein ACFX12_037446 [Malus domestica]
MLGLLRLALFQPQFLWKFRPQTMPWNLHQPPVHSAPSLAPGPLLLPNLPDYQTLGPCILFYLRLGPRLPLCLHLDPKVVGLLPRLIHQASAPRSPLLLNPMSPFLQQQHWSMLLLIIPSPATPW